MKTAQEWLTELSKGTRQAYPNIKRTDMVAGLKERLLLPKRIDQKNTSLCGAASLLYCLASLKSDVYAQYVVDLYHTGKSKIGKLDVQPGSDCKRYTPSTTKGIHPVDWVALASLRDSENSFFDYDEPSDEVGGITMPGTLVTWFSKSGFSRLANFTNLVFTKDETAIRDLGNRIDQKYSVCLFINSNLLNTPNRRSLAPDHWVVVVSPVVLKDNRVRLSVYTWGNVRPIDLTVSEFCKNFYGYISGAPN